MVRLIEPGTLLLLIAGGFVLAGMYGWFSDSFERVRNDSVQKQERAIDCTTFQVEFIDSTSEGNRSEVFLQSSHDLEALLVIFHGDDGSNSTTVLRDVSRNSVVSASANISQLERVEARAKSCDRQFTSR